MDVLKTLSGQLKSNKISRRGFMQQGLAAGVSVSALSMAAYKFYAATP